MASIDEGGRVGSQSEGRSCHWRRSLLGNVSNGLGSLQVAVCAHSLVNSQVLLVVTTQQLCEKNSRHGMGHRGMYLYTVRQSNAGSIGDHHRPMSGAQVGGTVPDLAGCPVTLWSTSSCQFKVALTEKGSLEATTPTKTAGRPRVSVVELGNLL